MLARVEYVRRRQFISLLGGAAVAWSFAVRAHQPGPVYIGVLGSLSSMPYA